MSNDGGWILPDDVDTDNRVCVQVQIPDTLEYRAAFVGAIYQLTYWFNWQRTGDDSGSRAAHNFRLAFFETLVIDDCGDMPCPPHCRSYKPTSPPATCDLPCGVDFEDCNGDGIIDTINIYESEDILNVNIYESNCGCGCGGKQAGEGGTVGDNKGKTPKPPGFDGIPGYMPPPADDADSTVDSDFRPADAAVCMVDYILDLCEDFITTLENAAGVTDDAIEAFTDAFFSIPYIQTVPAEAVDLFLSIVLSQPNRYRDMLNNVSFRESAYAAMAKVVNGRSGDWNLSRRDLFMWSMRMPYVWGVVPTVDQVYSVNTSLAMFSQMIDFNRVSARARVCAGTVSDAEAAQVWGNAGLVYDNRPAATDENDENIVQWEQDGNIYQLEYYRMSEPLVARNQNNAVLPRDYTDEVLVAGGFFITANQMTDLGNPNQQPRLWWNDGNTSTSDSSMPTGTDWLAWFADPAELPQPTREQIRTAVESLAGRETDFVFTMLWDANPEEQIWVAHDNVLTDGSATVSGAFVVIRNPAP